MRKLPFLAHALFIQKPSASIEEYLVGLNRAVKKYKEDSEKLLVEKS